MAFRLPRSVPVVAAKKLSKRIPKPQAEAIARHVRDFIDREYGGVQRAAERGTGISQSHLSALMRPEDRRGPGLSILIRLRSLLHMSIDDMLDLPPLTPRTVAPPPQETIKDQVRAALLELVKESQRPEEEDPPEPPASSKGPLSHA